MAARRHEISLRVLKNIFSTRDIKGSTCLYKLKGDLSPVMLKEIFHDS